LTERGRRWSAGLERNRASEEYLDDKSVAETQQATNTKQQRRDRQTPGQKQERVT